MDKRVRTKYAAIAQDKPEFDEYDIDEILIRAIKSKQPK